MKKLLKVRMSWLAVISALMLAGCGGGGGGGGGSSSSEPPEVDDNTVRLSSTAVAEGQNGSLTIESEKLSDDVKRAVSNSDKVSASFSNGTLSIEVDEIDRPLSAVILLGDGKGNALARMSIALRNQSAQALVDEVGAWESNSFEITHLEEDRQLYKLLVQQAYLNRQITPQQKASLLADWTPSEQSSYERVDQALKELSQALSDYQNSKIGDSALEGALEDVKAALADHHRYALGLIEQIQNQSTSNLEIVNKAIKYDAESGTVSRYVGNSDIGGRSESGWRFFESFKHIEIAVDASKIDVCRQEV